MSSVETWAANVLRTIEPDGPDSHVSCERVQFLTSHDFEVWETWWAPFASPEAFAADVESRVRSYEEQWPTRKVSCLLRAISNKGETLSQLPIVVVGKHKEGSLDGFQAAQASAMDGVATTIEKLHSLTNTQLDQARMVIELQNETIRQQVQLLTLYRHKEINDAPEGADSVVREIAKEHGDTIMGMLSMLVEHNTKGKPDT